MSSLSALDLKLILLRRIPLFLPARKVMPLLTRCDHIANECISIYVLFLYYRVSQDCFFLNTIHALGHQLILPTRYAGCHLSNATRACRDYYKSDNQISAWSTRDAVWNAIGWEITPPKTTASPATTSVSSFITRRLNKIREARTLCMTNCGLLWFSFNLGISQTSLPSKKCSIWWLDNLIRKVTYLTVWDNLLTGSTTMEIQFDIETTARNENVRLHPQEPLEYSRAMQSI